MPTPAAGSAKKDRLFEFLRILLAARNGLNSGTPADLAKTATTTLETSIFFLTHASRQLFFNVLGLMLFFISFLYDVGIQRHKIVGFKKIFEEHAEGKGLRLLIGFISGTIGSALLYTQSDPKQQHNLVLSISWILLSFAGYATSEGDFTNTASSVLKKLKHNPTPEQLEEAQFQLGADTKNVLEQLMQLVTSYRNSVLSGGGSNVVGSSNGKGLVSRELQQNYALIEILFGGINTGLFLGSIAYDVLSGRARRVGFAKTWEGHFSGKRAELIVASILSLTGGLLMLIIPAASEGTNAQSALEFARTFLYFSGFLTGPKAMFQILFPAATSEEIGSGQQRATSIYISSPPITRSASVLRLPRLVIPEAHDTQSNITSQHMTEEEKHDSPHHRRREPIEEFTVSPATSASSGRPLETVNTQTCLSTRDISLQLPPRLQATQSATQSMRSPY